MEGREVPEYSFPRSLREVLFNGPLNILLFCIPVAFGSYYSNYHQAITFLFAVLSLAPLAERMGFCTEQLTIHTNETISGLLNATFGNATELLVGLIALRRGLYRVVQLSLIGSVLSNLLLVLGCSLFVGGLRFKEQHFRPISSQVNSSLLVLSSMSLVFPTLLSFFNGTQGAEETRQREINFSRATSLCLFILYWLFLYFQLFSHRHLYEDSNDPTPSPPPITTTSSPRSITFSINNEKSKEIEMNALRLAPTRKAAISSSLSSSSSSSPLSSSPLSLSYSSLPQSSSKLDHSRITNGDIENNNNNNNHNNNTHSNSQTGEEEEEEEMKSISEKEVNDDEETDEDEEEDEEEEEDILGFYYSLFWLGITTILVTFLSDFIAATIQSASRSVKLSGIFLSTIILPIVGNAAEHAGAVMFAYKNKVDLSLGIALGSSVQISLLVLPFMCLVGWINHQPMSLNFGLYESFSLFFAVVMMTFCLKDGKSNWLIGLILIFAYIIIAIGYLARVDEDLNTEL